MHLRRRRHGGRAHRVRVRRERHRHLELAEEGDGGLPGLVKGQVRTGKEGRDGARLRHRLHRRPRGVLEVVGGEPAVLRDDPARPEVGVLVGMELDREAEGLRAVEKAPDLRVAVSVLVAEAVDLVDDPLSRRLGQDLLAHERHVVVAPPGELLGGKPVRAEVGGDDGDRQVLAERPRHPHLAELGIPVEAGAGLALHRGDPVRDEPAHAPPARRVERLLGERAGTPRHRPDPGPRGLQVPPPAALGQHLEIVKAFFSVDDMGVRIHEPRGDDLATEVAHPRRLVLPRRGTRPDPGDLPVRYPDRCVRDEPERLLAVHRSDVGVCQQKVVHAYRSSLRNRHCRLKMCRPLKHEAPVPAWSGGPRPFVNARFSPDSGARHERPESSWIDCGPDSGV